MKRRRGMRSAAAKAGVTTLGLAAVLGLPGMAYALSGSSQSGHPVRTATPIKHLVIIYGENVSFDHYFGTYPNATNPANEPTFTAKSKTPLVNGLQPNAKNGNTDLTQNNPNGVDPARLDRNNVNDVLTCDQNHSYGPEQAAFDQGKMDKFLSNVATGTGKSPEGQPCNADVNLDYYDGNTVTALWNYAQHFAMSDNSFSTTFGPSTPGAINVVSGDTGNVAKMVGSVSSAVIADGDGGFSDIGDTAPYYDDCPDSNGAISFSGKNVGDELNAAGVSWGWFEGGFTPTTTASAPSNDSGYVSPLDPAGYESGTAPAACGTTHDVGAALGGTGTTGAQPYGVKSDYIAHHEPFQYYASTANPHHLAPTSLAAVGTDTESYSSSGQPEFNTANHQYDMSTFNDLLTAIDQGKLSPSHLPAISYLKAPGYQDGHQGYSDPIDEQQFVTSEINALEKSPDWSSTAVILAYDDSDGFYDHVDAATENGGQPQNASQTSLDSLTGPGQCGTATPALTNDAGQPEQGRCGLGPRQPFLVVSPYAKADFVSDKIIDQSSVVQFIQQNWGLPPITGSAANIAGSIDNMFNFKGGTNPRLLLNTSTGEPVKSASPVQHGRGH